MAGLGPPEAQVMLIGRIRTHKRQIRSLALTWPRPGLLAWPGLAWSWPGLGLGLAWPWPGLGLGLALAWHLAWSWPGLGLALAWPGLGLALAWLLKGLAVP